MLAMAGCGEMFSCCTAKPQTPHDTVEHMDERMPTKPVITDLPVDDGKHTDSFDDLRGDVPLGQDNVPPGQERMPPESPAQASNAADNQASGAAQAKDTPAERSSNPSGHGAEQQGSGCCMCCALTDEKLNNPGYDEHQALDNAWWCCYCCCAGWGGSSVSTRPFLDMKCCCFNQQCKQVRCETTEDGVCSLFQACCCCLYVFQLPRRDLTPDCMICNYNPLLLCTKSRQLRLSTGDVDTENMHDSALEHFLCCYTRCMGCACAPGMLACVRNRTKCCCCNVASGVFLPTCQEESIQYGWCGHYLACWRVYSQCKLPFLYWEVPCLACCGRRCRQPSSEYTWR